jgi:hypothetical protein
MQKRVGGERHILEDKIEKEEKCVMEASANPIYLI